jgi:hypothetical protein
MAENYTIEQIPYNSIFNPPSLSEQDINLIGSSEETGFISTTGSNIEFGIYDLNTNLLFYEPNYNNWSSEGLGNDVNDGTLSTLNIDPGKRC